MRLTRLAGCGDSVFIWPLEVAFFVRASNHRSSLQKLFDQEFAAASWTFFCDWLIGRREFALGIVAAAIKRVSFAGLFLDQIAFFAQRTLHANEILLHVLAVGISAARSEFAVAAVADHQITPAFRAGLI